MAAYTYGPQGLPVGQANSIPAIGTSGDVFYGNTAVAIVLLTGFLAPVADLAGIKFVGFTTMIPPGPSSVTGDGVTINLAYSPVQGGVQGNQFMTYAYTGVAPIAGNNVFWLDTATVGSVTTNSILAGVALAVDTVNKLVTIKLAY